MNYKYSGAVMSDLESIKFFLEDILGEISNLIKDENTIFDIRLILNELILNGAIHGNKLTKNKSVRLDIALANDKMEIFVEDEGEGIECSLESYKPDELKCCGRGLIIVDRLSDELFIDKNKVMVVKNLL